MGTTPIPGQRPATLTYTTDKRGHHHWAIRSSNGKLLVASPQGYITRGDAQKNVMRLGALLGGYQGGYGDRLFLSADAGAVLLWA